MTTHEETLQERELRIFPPFESKEQLLKALEGKKAPSPGYSELLRRLGNTHPATWPDPDYRLK